VRRLAVLTAATAAAVGLGSGAGVAGWTGADSTMTPSAVARAAAREPFLGVVNPEPNTGNTAAILARLDPLSLRPVSPTVEMGEYHRAWSVSPDGSQLALGISSGVSLVSPPRPLRGRIGVIIVDLRAMEIVQEVETGASADALAWLAPRRLVAAVGGTMLIDPRAGKIVRRGLGFSGPLTSLRTRGRAVMLFLGPYIPAGSRRGHGSAAVRLAVFDAQGRVRSVTLDRLRLTFRGGARWDDPGLIVDQAHARAYVFAADAPVAQIDLRTLRTSYHRLDFLFLRPGELQGPAARPERLLNRFRDAIWLGEGRVLVSGRDVVAGRGGREAFVPSGATLVDTVSWRWRTLDVSASGAAFAAGRLLAYGPRSYPAMATGLRGYTLGGRRDFHLLKGQRVFDVKVVADRAYVRTPRAVRVVDVGRGEVVGNIVPPRDLIDVIIAPS